MKYESTYFSAEMEDGILWITDLHNNITASFEAAEAGDLDISPNILEDIGKFFNY